MRAAALTALLITAACSQPQGSASPAASAAPSPTDKPVATCKLPVWWSVNTDISVAQVSVPDGAISDAHLVPLPRVTSNPLASFQFYGATYMSGPRKWFRANRSLLSPDGHQYAYFDAQETTATIHVLDLGTGVDNVIYSGSTLYFPIAFLDDGIYLVHAIAPRQGAFEHLYRVNPSGGAIRPVPGSDRHMYQSGWVMIADGAAWGIDNRVEGTTYFYSILRLDLATSQVTRWFEGPADVQFWPDGVDGKHRLFVTDGRQLFRLDAATQPVQLPDPGPVAQFGGPGATPVIFTDSSSVWFAGAGGVWRYLDVGTPTFFAAGPADSEISPAGPCS